MLVHCFCALSDPQRDILLCLGLCMSAQGQWSKAGSETVGPVGRCCRPGRIQLVPKGPLALPASPASSGSSASFSAFESHHTPPPPPVRLPAGTVPTHSSAPPSLLRGLGSRVQVQGPRRPPPRELSCPPFSHCRQNLRTLPLAKIAG